MQTAVIPVILSGGAGTRLWPLSRELRPKQFLPLVTERTMLQETYLRTRALAELLRPPIVVCNEAHRFLVAEQMRAAGAEPQTIVLEPEGRNTAPAVAVAARVALEGAGAEDPLLLVLPADHVIADTGAFVAAVRIALEPAARGCLVTFGVVPDRPETGYGYLRKGEPGSADGGWYRLEQFVEKPDLSTALDYVKSNAYLWNSGMFVFSARKYLEELERHAPDIAAAAQRAAEEAVADKDFTRLGAAFLDCRSDSIDYAVMEKTASAAVVPLDAGWSDVGSWPALHDVVDKDADRNALRGDILALDCRDSYIAATHRLVAAVGLEGYVVVETADAVLVMPKGRAQDVKRAVDALKKAGRPEASVESPRRGARAAK
ncbi:MAG TPA: mannose-1-phosphate guanylyltransferase/mannose-6-phosphate isomerase [Gammaproteobacteria bacterium]